jgi:N-hydroxyarylamine O-acetyltransferase
MGTEQPTTHESYRIEQIDQGFALFIHLADEWRALYEFDLQPQQPIDYEAMNHYVQTRPGSIFRTVLMAGRPDATGRYALGGNRLSRYEKGRLVEQRTLESAAALRSALENELALVLPDNPGLERVLSRVAEAGTI